MLEPAAVPAPAATSPSLTPPAGTISTAPTLMPSAPVLPALPAATTPAQP
jgi:hypothetical protein